MKGKNANMGNLEALIGQKIKLRLEQIGITQKELAIRADLTEAAISRYISGQRTPNLANAKRIADALYVDMGWLVGETQTLRDCENCKYHTDGGCTKWDCEYEKREEE